MEIINFEEKEMIRNKEIKSCKKQKVCHICKKMFCYDKNKKQKSQKSLSLHCKT